MDNPEPKPLLIFHTSEEAERVMDALGLPRFDETACSPILEDERVFPVWECARAFYFGALDHGAASEQLAHCLSLLGARIQRSWYVGFTDMDQVFDYFPLLRNEDPLDLPVIQNAGALIQCLGIRQEEFDRRHPRARERLRELVDMGRAGPGGGGGGRGGLQRYGIHVRMIDTGMSPLQFLNQLLGAGPEGVLAMSAAHPDASRARPGITTPINERWTDVLPEEKEEEVDEEPDPEWRCRVCLHARKTVMLAPCQHLCVCDSCMRALYATAESEDHLKCPVCRHRIDRIWRPIF